ncbi:TonB-dependent receptor [uncultured Proteiniphilum sp.]|uniref:TonB-dependent receptor n=1 Tax=uncultured Proteiniphilum sp. TaxID=497637 RepID=UPI00260EACBA|nr:TonB-dependent receptor [uncultured Proteiniphilum sp.]
MNVQIKRIGVSCLLLLLLSIGQSIAQLSISATNTEIKSILRQIEEKSDYTFFYSDNFLDLNQKVTIQTKDETIENILNTLFRNTNIDYRINNTQIALSERRKKENSVNIAQQQGKTIIGTILDNAGDPVIGATVVEKGNPSHGTITDIDGNFTLSDLPENAILQITYVGMKPQEVAIKGRTTINVAMEPDAELLDELVVIGYGTMKKKLVTGATVQVKGEDISRLNTPNVLGALQSQAPGVNITQVSGFIGDGFKINIRGIGSNYYSTPLFVIDGVVGGTLDGLSPNDIESIDVLKDAATAAIYGSRAANGVILVKTKSGQVGKHEITYDGYYGIQNLYKMPTVLNAQEFMNIQNESRIMDGLPIYNWENLIPGGDLASIRDGSWKGTNWIKEILNKNALIQSHSIGINSGTERSVSSLGFTFFQQEATMGVPSNIPILNRFNARINTESTILKKGDLDILKVGETLNYRFNRSQGQVARDDIYWNTIHNSLVMSPLMHAYNSQGEYYMYDDQIADGYNWDTANSANKNPIAYMDYMMNQNLSKSHSLQSSVYMELKPIKNLTFRSQFGYLLSTSSYRSYVPSFGKLTATLEQGQDRVTQSMSQSQYLTWDNTINYVLKFGAHNVDALLGQGMTRQMLSESMSGSNQGSIFYDFDHAWLSNVPGLNTIQSLTGSPTLSSGGLSVFGRVNYNYNETYMASFILRADGSSYFAPGHRWGYFPSVSAGWVISNENFWKENIQGVDFLKLRASYGSNGNDRVMSFQYIGLITSNNNYGGYPFGNSMDDAATGSYAYRGVNPELKWETQTMINVGADANFFNNRMRLELDWYNRVTRDWLVAPPQPADFGVDPAYINGGDVQNTGFEMILGWNEQVSKDFYFDTNLSLSYNKNKVLKIANSEKILHGPPSVLWEGSEESYRSVIGKPFGYFYGYKSSGIFQNQRQIDEYAGAKLLGDNTQPGDVIWQDIDGNGTIDAKDRTEIGNPHPDFTLGFSFNVNYKGIELNVNTYGAFGHQILKSYRDFVASPMANYTTDIFQRWHGEGTSNKFPRLSSSVSSNWNRISDIYIEDGDYFKIKNVSLGYDFKRAFKGLPFSQLKIYVTAQNLFTFTGYTGMDPEIGYGAGSDYPYAQGIDLGFYPSSRVYMIGMNIKF